MKMMRMIILEEIGYLLSEICILMQFRYSERLAGVNFAAVWIFIAAGIAAMNLVDSMLGTRMKDRTNRLPFYIARLLSAFAVNYIAFSMVEHFGNVPASFRTLLIVSALFTGCHFLIFHWLPGAFEKVVLRVDKHHEIL